MASLRARRSMTLSDARSAPASASRCKRAASQALFQNSSGPQKRGPELNFFWEPGQAVSRFPVDGEEYLMIRTLLPSLVLVLSVLAGDVEAAMPVDRKRFDLCTAPDSGLIP